MVQLWERAITRWEAGGIEVGKGGGRACGHLVAPRKGTASCEAGPSGEHARRVNTPVHRPQLLRSALHACACSLVDGRTCSQKRPFAGTVVRTSGIKGVKVRRAGMTVAPPLQAEEGGREGGREGGVRRTRSFIWTWIS